LVLCNNTHTENHGFWNSHDQSLSSGRHIIKHHVHASSDDVLITDGTGMTGVVNKFQFWV
jgi:selenocysteine lyase/cysteine desulfurase